MKWEFKAAYGTPDMKDITQIMKNRDLSPSTRIDLLTSALATPYKELARAHYRVLIQDGEFQSQGIRPDLDCLTSLGLVNFSDEALSVLPEYSWFLSFKFRLTKPYLSRDDAAFHIIDNPLRKDKIFKVPMVAPSQWKGALQSAIAQDLMYAVPGAKAEEEAFAAQRLRLCLLFGDEKGLEEEHTQALARLLDERTPGAKSLYRQKLRKHFAMNAGDNQALPHHRGRLRFYPSFFTQIGLAVINPHDRASKTGKNPIYLECVPVGADASFTLLYVPFDLVGRTDTEVRRQVGQDLCMVAQGLYDMFTLYGFGAKTSSGFGVAEMLPGVKGRFTVKAKTLEKKRAAETPLAPREPEIVQEFRQQYPQEDFSKKAKVWQKAQDASSGQRNKYQKARQAYLEYQTALGSYQTTVEKRKKILASPEGLTTERSFADFTELLDKTHSLAESWGQNNE